MSSRPRPVRRATARGGPVGTTPRADRSSDLFRRTVRAWEVLALLAGLLLLAGCAARPPAPAPVPTTGDGFNENDVMFLQMMVPHLEQGLTIARLARERASRADVRGLAAAIETTQSDEAATMSARLRDWRQPATAKINSHHDHGGMPRIVDIEMAALRKANGPDFDRRFLNVMIAHQDDAIQLARVETATGSDPGAKALADRVDRSRSAQIRQMLDFLGQG